VEVISAATIWVLFGCFLVFPHLGAPVAMQRTAGALLGAEFLAVCVWAFGSEDCSERPCAPVAEAGRAAAMIDVPLLAIAFVALAAIYAARSIKSSDTHVGRSRRRSPQAPAVRTGQRLSGS